MRSMEEETGGAVEFSGQTVRIYPLTRVQGRADIEVFFDPDQQVNGARFRALEQRGFEQLITGMSAVRAPQVLSRICGCCGPFHQLAACMALEDALSCEVPEEARIVRELLCWLWWADSHLVFLTYTALPDLALPMSDVSVRNIAGIYMVEEEIVGLLCSAREAFGRVLRLLAGLPVHPSVVVPGGLARLPGSAEVKDALELLMGCRDGLEEVLRLVEMLIKRSSQMMYTGTPLNGHYMSLVSGDGFSHPMGGSLRVEPFSDDGENAVMSPVELMEHSRLESYPWSYMKAFVLEQFDPCLVGPLARANIGYGPAAEWACSELEACRETWEEPMDREFLVYHALVLEVIRAWETSIAILDSLEAGGKPCGQIEISGGEGLAALESPRGTVFHHAEVGEAGEVAGYRVVSPLQFNYTLMNEHLSGVSRKVVKGVDLTETVTQRLQLAVRSFCPCVSCGTH